MQYFDESLPFRREADLSTRELRALESRAQNWMRARLPDAMQSRATGKHRPV
ncbi:MAG: hypothetical protein WBM52_09050 [Thiogranum sp.]